MESVPRPRIKPEIRDGRRCALSPNNIRGSIQE
jgi:hypothetical protein